MVSCRIYVVEHAPNSQRAIQNLTAFCRAHLPELHRIEIIDVFTHPERALADKILLTPTLVVDSPLPARRVVGDLSDGTILRQALTFGPEAPEDPARPDA
jgi:circadian clock protein KaiB